MHLHFLFVILQLAGEIGAHAVSHLERVSDTGITSMSNSETVGVLLPTTAYILRLEYPPARKMIEQGMAIALGSDFNPNAYCMSMVSWNYNGLLLCCIMLY